MTHRRHSPAELRSILGDAVNQPAVLVLADGSTLPVTVTRASVETDQVDVTTANYWVRHQRHQYVDGMSTATVEVEYTP